MLGSLLHDYLFFEKENQFRLPSPAELEITAVCKQWLGVSNRFLLVLLCSHRSAILYW